MPGSETSVLAEESEDFLAETVSVSQLTQGGSMGNQRGWCVKILLKRSFTQRVKQLQIQSS